MNAQLALLPQRDNIIDFPQKKSNEWYTPVRYIEAARRVMGSIDLDPASCEEANRIVKAKQFYTEKQDGLKQRWGGRMWLNPPYSSPQSPAGMTGGKQQGPTALFIAKAIDAFECGDVEQAILCVNADTVRTWFQALYDYALCLTYRPIQFLRPNEKSEHHFFGTAFAYLGKNEHAFVDVFSEFGAVIPAGSAIRRKPVKPLSLWEVL